MSTHPTHKTRMSDASSFDEICEMCGNTDSAPAVRDDPLEKPCPAAVTGYVDYDVRADCPHCARTLHLNQYPYNDDQSEYCLAEDELGLALFGKTTEPAQWSKLNITYKCCGCKREFKLNTLMP